MATHSSVLAWRIPGTGEPGGLPSMGSHRVGHDWSDLAAAAYCFPLAAQAYILTWGFHFPTPSATFVVCGLLMTAVWQVWNDIPLCFWCAFLMTILLAICMPSLEKISIQIFCPIFKSVSLKFFFFSWYRIVWTFYILWLHGCCMFSCSVVTLCNPTDCSPPGSSVHGIF